MTVLPVGCSERAVYRRQRGKRGTVLRHPRSCQPPWRALRMTAQQPERRRGMQRFDRESVLARLRESSVRCAVRKSRDHEDRAWRRRWRAQLCHRSKQVEVQCRARQTERPLARSRNERLHAGLAGRSALSLAKLLW